MFDPIADWSAKSQSTVEGEALTSGHYLAEEVPQLVLARLKAFLAG
jgi:haloacetate dehalogenase